MPVSNIPINRGRVVNDIKKPPIFAATANNTKPNNFPPGAAVSPTITYNVIHATIPIQKKFIEMLGFFKF